MKEAVRSKASFNNTREDADDSVSAASRMLSSFRGSQAAHEESPRER